MGNCCFLYDNEWDSGTLTASSNATNYPANHTRHRWHTRTWRSANLATPDYLLLDAGANISVKACILRYTNFNSTGTFLIQANTADNWAAPALNEALPHNTTIMHYFWSSNQNYQYWRVAMNDANNPENYVEVGRVYLGSYLEPSRNYILGGGMREWVDPSAGAYSDDGQVSSIQKTKYRVGTFVFSKLPGNDANAFQNMFESVGSWKPLFFCADSNSANNNTYYVRITSYQITPEYNNRYTISLDLEELR